jgi:hypothetical protein
VIRLLQAKYKRKFDVAINPGNDRTAPVGPPAAPWYPDLVLQSSVRGRKLLGVVEVETAESLNNLEAMSQWAAFARLRVPFHLYVPVSGVDAARRLCVDLNIQAAEIWAYHSVGDQMRFTLVLRAAQPGARTPRAAVEHRARPAGSERRPARRPGAAGGARRAGAGGSKLHAATKKKSPTSRGVRRQPAARPVAAQRKRK